MTKDLDSYWSTRYRNQTTGWDLGQASPPLMKYAETIENRDIKILIPGCGNAYEAFELYQLGFRDITLVDISEELCLELQSKVEEKGLGSSIKVVHRDFFDLSGEFDLMFEQTFFCAIDPTLRAKYVLKVNDLLNDGGKLVGVLFNRNFEGGPPFGGSQEEYYELFRPFFGFNNWSACYNSIPPRQGSEWFMELIKL